MTKAELIALLAAQKAKKININWGQFIALLNKADNDEQATIINSLNSGDIGDAVRTIAALVKNAVRKDAKTDIATKLSGQNVKIDDLLDIYS